MKHIQKQLLKIVKSKIGIIILITLFVVMAFAIILSSEKEKRIKVELKFYEAEERIRESGEKI